MDWQSAKQHCKERDWQWSLDLINKVQKEMEDLEAEVQRLKEEKIFGKPHP